MGRWMESSWGPGAGSQGGKSQLGPWKCWALKVVCVPVGSWQPWAGWCAFPSLVSEGGPRGCPCGLVGAGGVLGRHCVDASSGVGTGPWVQAGVLACCSPVLGGEQMLGE